MHYLDVPARDFNPFYHKGWTEILSTGCAETSAFADVFTSNHLLLLVKLVGYSAAENETSAPADAWTSRCICWMSPLGISIPEDQHPGTVRRAVFIMLHRLSSGVACTVNSRPPSLVRRAITSPCLQVTKSPSQYSPVLHLRSGANLPLLVPWSPSHPVCL